MAKTMSVIISLGLLITVDRFAVRYHRDHASALPRAAVATSSNPPAEAAAVRLSAVPQSPGNQD